MEDTDAFREAVRPLIHEFIFSQYDKFASSQLTFRDLKLHVAAALELPYEQLREDGPSSVIEDESDKIANQCDGGKVDREACIARFQLKDET
eukprot:CAMPEP_0195570206 /NCGR_PEP_ID=MMETSP0814-20130614/3298_1 /TAXON_ID=97485 /ORGANISM="Prymnesium parvum, Strain Texoma1" /LENGTH=91 /DNA_ID=CAMNT_0040705659 /DNA_START=91 /DNA_END=366 /DNA_ORIENTATION=-